MRLFTTLFLLFALTNVMGQMPIEVKIEERPSSIGLHSAFEVVVPQATPSEAIDLMKKTITPRSLFKKSPTMEKVKDEWIVRGVIISDITNMPLDVITQVSSFPDNLYVRVFLQTEGGFLGSQGSSEQATDAAMRYFRNYGVNLYRLAVGKEIANEENTLKALRKDMERLVKQNKTFDNKIDDIQKDKDDFSSEADYSEQLLKDSRKNSQGETMDSKKAVEDELKKQLKSAKKEVKRAKSSEKKYEKKVNKNKKSQRDKAREIELQEQKLEELKIKLENIR